MKKAQQIKAKTNPSLVSGQNKLFYGDNLDVLRKKISDETVDLCYIDPPFNSKRNYFQIYNNIGTDGDKAQSQAFMDTWEWGNEAIDGLAYIKDVQHLNNRKFTPQTVALIQGLEQVLGHGDLFAYIVHMTLRVVEIHRVLKSNGSFYLHCDPTASHYLKLVLDSVFCASGNGGDFQNEISWCYGSGGASKSHYSRKHDVIFYYTKGASWTFNVDDVREPYSSPHKSMTPKVVGDKEYVKMHPLGRIPFDWWQIPILTNSAKERLGYPTQKPEALLERIIKASSNEGDVILDAYCGCGTTVAVAQRLKRRWIGIDITYQSISLILKRLKDKYEGEAWVALEANLLLDGVPRDYKSAVALANRKDDKTRKEFEKWAVLTYSDNQARINEKKGGDGGIDGLAFFLKDKEVNGKVVLSVKSDKSVQPAYVDQLAGTMVREKADFGILLCLNEPSKGAYKRAQENGRYKHPMLSREDDRIQIVTVEQILSGKRIDLPMGRIDAVKAAEAEGDSESQAILI